MSSAIRIDKCKNIELNNIKTIGFNTAVHATETEDLRVTNVNALKEGVSIDSLIREFNELIKDGPFDNSNITIEAVDFAIEIKKVEKDTNKINKFIQRLKSIKSVIDKSSELYRILKEILEPFKQ